MNTFNQRNSLVSKTLSDISSYCDPAASAEDEYAEEDKDQGHAVSGDVGNNNNIVDFGEDCNCPKCRRARHQLLRRNMNSAKLKRLYGRVLRERSEKTHLPLKTQFFPANPINNSPRHMQGQGQNSGRVNGNFSGRRNDEFLNSGRSIKGQKQQQSHSQAQPPWILHKKDEDRDHQRRINQCQQQVAPENSTKFVVNPRKLIYTPSPPPASEEIQDEDHLTPRYSNSILIQQQQHSSSSRLTKPKVVSNTCSTCQRLLYEQPCCYYCRNKLPESISKPKVPDPEYVLQQKVGPLSGRTSQRSCRRLAPPGKPSAFVTIRKAAKVEIQDEDEEEEEQIEAGVPINLTKPCRNTTTAVLSIGNTVGGNICMKKKKKQQNLHSSNKFNSNSTPTCAFLSTVAGSARRSSRKAVAINMCSKVNNNANARLNGKFKVQPNVIVEDDEDLGLDAEELLDEEDDELFEEDFHYEQDYSQHPKKKQNVHSSQCQPKKKEQEHQLKPKPSKLVAGATGRPLRQKFESEPCIYQQFQGDEEIDNEEEQEELDEEDVECEVEGDGYLMDEIVDGEDLSSTNPSMNSLGRGYGVTSRYMTDLQRRIYQAINIYVYRNGIENHVPTLIHIPPSKKKSMKCIMSVIQDRMKYPIGYAKTLYKMDGSIVRHPCELEMYNKYVVASSYQKHFKPVEYGRLKSPLLILGNDSKNIHVKNKKNDYETWKKQWRIHGPRYVNHEEFYSRLMLQTNDSQNAAAGGDHFHHNSGRKTPPAQHQQSKVEFLPIKKQQQELRAGDNNNFGRRASPPPRLDFMAPKKQQQRIEEFNGGQKNQSKAEFIPIKKQPPPQKVEPRVAVGDNFNCRRKSPPKMDFIPIKKHQQSQHESSLPDMRTRNPEPSRIPKPTFQQLLPRISEKNCTNANPTNVNVPLVKIPNANNNTTINNGSLGTTAAEISSYFVQKNSNPHKVNTTESTGSLSSVYSGFQPKLPKYSNSNEQQQQEQQPSYYNHHQQRTDQLTDKNVPYFNQCSSSNSNNNNLSPLIQMNSNENRTYLAGGTVNTLFLGQKTQQQPNELKMAAACESNPANNYQQKYNEQQQQQLQFTTFANTNGQLPNRIGQSFGYNVNNTNATQFINSNGNVNGFGSGYPPPAATIGTGNGVVNSSFYGQQQSNSTSAAMNNNVTNLGFEYQQRQVPSYLNNGHEQMTNTIRQPFGYLSSNSNQSTSIGTSTDNIQNNNGINLATQSSLGYLYNLSAKNSNVNANQVIIGSTNVSNADNNGLKAGIGSVPFNTTTNPSYLYNSNNNTNFPNNNINITSRSIGTSTIIDHEIKPSSSKSYSHTSLFGIPEISIPFTPPPIQLILPLPPQTPPVQKLKPIYEQTSTSLAWLNNNSNNNRRNTSLWKSQQPLSKRNVSIQMGLPRLNENDESFYKSLYHRI